MTLLISKKIKIIALINVLLSTTACGWLTGDEGVFRDRSNDYRKSKDLPPLTLPAGVKSDSIDDGYMIPEISDRAELSSDFVVPRPDALNEEVDREAVRINRLGDEQWILVNGSPGQVWPRLRGFFNLGGVAIMRADAVKGVLETTWIQPINSELSKERYQLRIEQGVQRGSSEVRVTQMAISAGQHWPEKSSSYERESALVTQLSQFLADSAIEGSVSMLAEQAIDSSGRVSIEQEKGSPPYILLQLPFYRAWASLDVALDKAGYLQDDLDASQKVFYVRYIPPEEQEEDEGWFSGWFSSDDELGEPKGVPYVIRVKSRNERQVEITIEQPSGEAFAEGEADKLLKLIKRQLT